MQRIKQDIVKIEALKKGGAILDEYSEKTLLLERHLRRDLNEMREEPIF